MRTGNVVRTSQRRRPWEKTGCGWRRKKEKIEQVRVRRGPILFDLRRPTQPLYPPTSGVRLVAPDSRLRDTLKYSLPKTDSFPPSSTETGSGGVGPEPDDTPPRVRTTPRDGRRKVPGDDTTEQGLESPDP